MDVELRPGETLLVRIPNADSLVTVEYGPYRGQEKLRITAETPDPNVSPDHRTIRGMSVIFRKVPNAK